MLAKPKTGTKKKKEKTYEQNDVQTLNYRH